MQFPVKPPDWRGEEIILGEPPLCKRCTGLRPQGSDSQLSLSSAEESSVHGSESSTDSTLPTRRATPEAAAEAWREVTPPETPMKRPTHVSIFRPLDGSTSHSPQAFRPLPAWLTDTSPLPTPPTFPKLTHEPPGRVIRPSLDGSEIAPLCSNHSVHPSATPTHSKTWPPTIPSSSTRHPAAQRAVPAHPSPPPSPCSPCGPPTFNRVSSRPLRTRSEAAEYLDRYRPSRSPSTRNSRTPSIRSSCASLQAHTSGASTPRPGSGASLATLPRSASSASMQRMTPVCRGAATRPAHVRHTTSPTPLARGPLSHERSDVATPGEVRRARDRVAADGAMPLTAMPHAGHAEVMAEKDRATRSRGPPAAVPTCGSLSALIASRANLASPPPLPAEQVVVRRVKWPSLSEAGALEGKGGRGGNGEEASEEAVEMMSMEAQTATAGQGKE